MKNVEEYLENVDHFLLWVSHLLKKKGLMIFLAQLNKHKCGLPSEKEIYIYLSRQLLPASLLK